MNKKHETAAVVFVLGVAQCLLLPELTNCCKGKDLYIFSTYPLPNTSSGKVYNIKPKKFFQKIYSLYSLFLVYFKLIKYKRIELYSPHLLNYFANKIYYNNKNRIDYYCLYDGILNYRRLKANVKVLKDYQDKQVLKSLVFFHRYVKSSSYVVDEELFNLRGMFVPEGVVESRLMFSGPIYKLPIDLHSFEPSGGILIMEPPVFEDDLRFFENKLLKVLKDNYQGRKVYIKPHPGRTVSHFNITRLRKFCDTVSIVESTKPAEIVFMEKKCSIAISSTSSALVLIKSVFEESTVVSILCESELQDQNLAEIIDLMKSIGISFV